MTNYLDSLLSRIDDADLRAQLADQVAGLRDTKEFGLVFERHLPEGVRLYTYPIKRGATVQAKAGGDATTWTVTRVSGSTAELRRDEGGESHTETSPVGDLVVVRQFNDPIYPGLKSVGKVEHGGDKPYHAVINAENYHALETLLYAYEGQVDCIYIDPPYNTGARDWKYNNNYVDDADQFRHSKWLSFMEKRLKLAKRLLNPEDSVLIVTIDEKEYLRLGLLLEQIFVGSRIQMVSSLINPASMPRLSMFSRSDEYLFFVFIGSASPARVPLGAEWISAKGRTFKGEIRWDLVLKSSSDSQREDSPGGFYPIYVDPDGPKIHSIGNVVPLGVERHSDLPEPGLVALWPIRRNGTEGRWRLSPETLRRRHAEGLVRLGGNPTRGYTLYYLPPAELEKIKVGIYSVTGHRPDGSMITSEANIQEGHVGVPSTQWRIAAHDATQYGSRLLNLLIPGRKFPFPKSLYAVEDALRYCVKGKPDALIVDFFGGSGTSTHAVARLNKQDDGRRRSIIVTNNEVSDAEAKILRERGFQEGDLEWEELGICEHITMPRISAAITGVTPEGHPIKGDYKFTDEFPMSEGFDANVEFFKLTYESRDTVSRGRAFASVAPLLWLKAGSVGARIDKITGTWSLPVDAVYGVLFDPKDWRGFVDAVNAREEVRHVFVVTDSMAVFQHVSGDLPAGVESTMLYEDYLSTFEINTGATR